MLEAKIEAVCFALARPLSLSFLQKQLGASQNELQEAIDALERKWNRSDSGIHLLEHDREIEFVTNPRYSETVLLFLKKERHMPLTRASLETLTVIAYLGPVSKAEMEYVRGVNCSLIVRNLLVRGFIQEDSSTHELEPTYAVSIDFLHQLGLTHLSELPEYERFHSHEKIQELLKKRQ